MYKHLYNQTVTYKKKSGTDQYSKPTFSVTKSINCIVEYKNKLLTSSTGQQITSQANLISDEVISIGDVINTQGRDYTVIQSSPLVDMDGITQAYRVYF